MAQSPSDARPSVRPNKVKQRISNGEIGLGAWCNLADPAVVEIIGLAGFDAVGINLEHCSFDLSLVTRMVVAAETVGIAPIVRVPAGAWDTALLVLDAGAQGIQISRVSTARQAREAVEVVRYAPLGMRGAHANSRAARFGAIPWPEFRDDTNREVLLTVMIEDEEALHHVEEIAAVEGVDLVMIGAADLSESIGATRPDDPRLKAAVQDVAARIGSVGRARMGFTLGHPFLSLTIAEMQAMGIVFANVSPQPEVLLRKALADSVRTIRNEWRAQDGSVPTSRFPHEVSDLPATV